MGLRVALSRAMTATFGPAGTSRLFFRHRWRHARSVLSTRARRSIHEEAGGHHDRGGAVRRCPGAGASHSSELAPAAALPMKSKPKTPAGGTVTVRVTNWREAGRAAGGRERFG
jgi:hypothetical protein